MINPLNPAHAGLADAMLQEASDLPRGRRVSLLVADDVILFGHEKASIAKTAVLLIQQRLFKLGIEPTAIAVSNDQVAWVILGASPHRGSRTGSVEAELEQLLRNLRLKVPRRRRGRAGK